MGKGKGFGKIILFGEHLVVYGAPAIAAGISNCAIVEVKEDKENHIVTNQKVIPELSRKGISYILESMNIKENYAVHLTGDLPTYGGLGSSAAFCVGLVRALASEKKLNLSAEDVNKHAHAGERAFHGNPSGIDNVAATYGGLVQFSKGKIHGGTGGGGDRFEHLKLGTSLNLVVSFTGKYGPTHEMVAKVKVFRDNEPEEFEMVLEEYLDLFNEAKKLLPSPTTKSEELGTLMNQNHELLKRLGVVDPLNQKIVDLARENGAVGAKVTGGGGGGCCISLCDNKSQCIALAKILTTVGFESFYTVI